MVNKTKKKREPYCIYTLATEDGGDVEDEGGVKVFYCQDDAMNYWVNKLKLPLEEIYILKFQWVECFSKAHKGKNKDQVKWRKV